jgi:hypothetical protein
MKTIRFVLGIAAGLVFNTIAVQAQPCGIHFGFNLPFISFGIGLGLGVPGAPCSWRDCGGYGYPYSAYAYAPPVYPWNQPTAYIPPVAADASPAPTVAQTSTWVPASPGVGHWLRDPEPYSYQPTVIAKDAPVSPPVVTEKKIVATKSPEGVPLYIVTQSPKPES